MRDCQFTNTSSRGSYIPHSYMEHITDYIIETEHSKLLKELKRLYRELSQEQESLPSSYHKIIEDNFWDIL